MNDVIHDRTKFVEAGTPVDSVLSWRLACLHLWKLAKFVRETREGWPEVQEFVDTLPEPAGEKLDLLLQAGQSDKIVQIRDLFAHYQEMDRQAAARPRDPVTRALREKAGDVGEVTLPASGLISELRLDYADDVIAESPMHVMPTTDEQKALSLLIANAGDAGLDFAQIALNGWFESLPDGTLEWDHAPDAAEER